MKSVVFCFDGTGQEPKDAVQENSKDNNSISNVLKLHLLLGGDLVNGKEHEISQRSFYYSGVGTRGNPLTELVRKAVAAQAPEKILDDAMTDLMEYNDCEIVVIGFSRGAAIARQFCVKIGQEYPNAVVSLLLCFDTVASMGMPDLSVMNRPDSDVVFEDESRSVARCIRQAVHCVSLDDKRTAFQPTLMNRDDRVLEVWFSGGHGDVGGGWERDGLSDTVLQFAKDRVKEFTDLTFLDVNDLLYESLGPIRKDDIIDMSSEKEGKGTVHKQKIRLPVSINPVRYHRKLVVVDSDKIDPDHAPLVHESVINRCQHDKDYRPQSLRNAKHHIWRMDGTLSEVKPGLEIHVD